MSWVSTSVESRKIRFCGVSVNFYVFPGVVIKKCFCDFANRRFPHSMVNIFSFDINFWLFIFKIMFNCIIKRIPRDLIVLSAGFIKGRESSFQALSKLNITS